ncbi:DUF2339 domain-containing protein [Paraliomyxa miuraensis]|uniref:hypothetical protein n=1 Tax=Paraliomyxa miuraensis TaxID=376150 RepID=UPI00225B822F|nr:hypothetical protein [Paraliomyxa miuraensis]MCX4239987.1 hypothetical protein [Paraliomyxa miuraensis]
MRQPLYTRLRPFLRRDLRARLVSALLSVVVLTGLTWLGVSALAGIDSREAHDLRIQLGLESPTQVCGSGPYLSECNYDDRVQEKVDREFHRRQGLRVSVLTDLDRRLDMALGQLDDAKRHLDEMVLAEDGSLQGDTVALRDALSEAIIDVSPAAIDSVQVRRARLLGTFERLEPTQLQAPKRARGMTALVNGRDVEVHMDPTSDQPTWVDDLGNQHRFRIQRPDVRTELLAAVASERDSLQGIQGRVRRLLRRDGATLDREPGAQQSRIEVVADLTPRGDESYDDFMRRLEVAGWMAARAHVEWLDDDAAFDRNAAMLNNPASVLVSDGLPEVDADLGRIARYDLEDLHEALTDAGAEIWEDGWYDDRAARTAVLKPMVRYRSPVTPAQKWRLFGMITFVLAGIMLTVVGPVVTATSTAREREAGTLPVLRMTGLSAGDLALAMAIGPNVFALVAGSGLLLLALPVLALTAGPSAVLLPLGVLLALAAATHLTAIGLGDALGQRVNAMVVGGLLGLAILGPGLVGSVMVVGDMAATGLLLGPLPAMVGESVRMSGLPFASLLGPSSASDMGCTMLGYAVLVQTMLGGLCLLSWRRRVEQAWSPLFRPLEGAALALLSVGCSALAVVDLSQRIHVQTYDTVNLITFVSTAFLMPVLGWLLVSSLVRPARASAVASCSEVRRAFGRFQLFVVLTAAALAGAYLMVLDNTHLRAEKSEVMWSTLTQALLVAETAVATLLLASRRREGKHRVYILGTAIALLQMVFAVAVYNLEVEHVAFTQKAGMPFMMGMESSPYWVAFLVVLWAAGLGMVLAALLRERDRGDKTTTPHADHESGRDEKGGRWLH